MPKSAAKRSKPLPSSASKLDLDIAKPFLEPPESYKPFYSRLSPKHVYITHIDTLPIDQKRSTFTLALVLNLLVIALLGWRIHTTTPFYVGLVQAFGGAKNEYYVNVSRTGWRALGSLAIRHVGAIFLDWFLFFYVLKWPRNFFIGYSNPLLWRLNLGFQPSEIIIRASRLPVATEFPESIEPSAPLMRQTMGAASPTFLGGRTGYLTQNGDFDLYYSLMIDAHKDVEGKVLAIDTFKLTAWIHFAGLGWMYWPIYKEGGEEGREKIIAFKEQLDRLGKESLFFSWIELIQRETSQPGGFTPERQDIAVQKAREMFGREGIDFDKFWERLGGRDAMPGMEVTVR